MGEGKKGNDALIVLSIGIVWVVCTFALGLTSMVMFGVSTAWTVGFAIFFLMAGGIWWADARGKKANAPEEASDSGAVSEEE